MTLEFLSLADCRLAYQRQVGNKNNSGIIFLCGFASDMEGSKASFLSQYCAERAIPFIRFDYRGCGQSSGKFSDGTIGAWLEDSLAVFDRLTDGPQIIVGSSMGGWLGLLLAKARGERVKAFIGIAAAPDFTEDLVWARLTESQREKLLREGTVCADDDGRAPLTLKLIEEGRKHLVLRQPLALSCPVRLLQGMKDKEVSPRHAERIAACVAHDDVRVTLVKGGDHHLSAPEDLALLGRTVTEFL
ncbi:MAG: alpha/beta hydrolase [Alphaproteobacteria bacterium]|nr:alpha/beta hydrolase [Alphaproteobacteria bacterium]